MKERVFVKDKRLLEPIIVQIQRLLHEDEVTFYLYDPVAEELELTISSDSLANEHIGARLKLGEGLAGSVAKNCDPMIVNDYKNWEGRSAQYEGVPWNNVMAAPMIYEGRLYGVVDVSDTSNPRTFEQEDLKILTALADFAALTLANAQLYHQAKTSTENHQKLLENSLVGIFVAQDETIVYANGQLAKIFGYEPEELLGQSSFLTVAPEDHDLLRQKLTERISGNVPMDQYIIRGRHKNGTTFPVEVFSSKIEFNGRPASQGMVIDISSRIESEQLLDQLLDIGTDILAETDTDTILQRVCDAMIVHSPFQTAAMSIFTTPVTVGQEQDLQIDKFYIAGVSESEKQEMIRLKDQRGLIINQAILEHGQPIGQCWYMSQDQHPEIKEKGIAVPQTSKPSDGAAWGAYDNLYILLKQGQQILGRISLSGPKGGQVPEASQLEPLEMLTNLATLAIHNVMQMDHLRQQKERLHGLYMLGQELAQLNDAKLLMQHVIDRLKHDFSYSYSSIFISEGNELILKAKDNSDPKHRAINDFPVGSRISISQGIMGHVATHKAPLLVNDVSKDERYIMSSPVTQAELCVPILLGSKLIGVLNIESSQKNAFEDSDIEVLSSVASQLALALTNLERYQALKDQAIRDPLTGLYNRRHFNEMLEQEIHRATRYRHSISILFVDVDNMHQINNDHGHLRGDFVLQEVAQLLKQTIRASDLVFRYGGDEFLAMLPEADVDIDTMTTRLTEAQQRWNETHKDLGLHMSLSMGTSIWQLDSSQTLEDLIQQADMQMYKNKRSR